MPKLRVSIEELTACWEEISSSGFFTEGKYVKLLEEEVSKWCGMEAIAVSNCGSGLFAVMRGLSPFISSNRGTVVQNNTFFATGAMVREAHPNHRLRVLDCSPESFGLSLEALKKENPQPDVVVMTHVGGALDLNYKAIAEYCLKRGIILVEDAAHTFGVKDEGLTAGSLGKAAVFSLYPTKAIPVGEGGIVVTRDKALAEAIRRFRNYGKYYKDGKLMYSHSGFNLRMDEWTAAVALLQFRKHEDIIASRTYAALQLHTVIPSVLGTPWGAKNNWYKYAVSRDQAELMGIKRFAGQIYAASDQLQQSLLHYTPRDPDELTGSKTIAETHVCLPIDEGLYSGKSNAQVLAWLRGEE